MKKVNFLFNFGRPFSPFYSALMRLREYLYLKGLFKVTYFDVPVVSVGNLTLGGTGKTPLVQYIARLLQENGKYPGIISRGYGGAVKEPINIVSDGETLLLDADTAGDEPRLLAETLPGVQVFTGVKRKYPAARAVKNGCNVLLLDDGFQHMAVGRDLDLILFNADTLAGNSRVFPGGDLREPVRALNRCHGFVITGTNDDNRERATRFAELLQERFSGRPVFLGNYKASSLVAYNEGSLVVKDYEVLNNKNVFGFCGIARPDGFEKSLVDFGLELVGFQHFSDHQKYNGQLIRKIVDIAKKNDASALVVTEKDLVKLRGLDLELPLYGLRMQVQLEEAFDRFVLSHLLLEN